VGGWWCHRVGREKDGLVCRMHPNVIVLGLLSYVGVVAFDNKIIVVWDYIFAIEFVLNIYFYLLWFFRHVRAAHAFC
jgi:hypothetical protein